MRWIMTAVLAAHGVAHLVGFAVNWQLFATPEVPFTTTVAGGRWDVGLGGIRFVGLLWLAAAGMFLAAAAAFAAGAPWALGATVAAVVVSLVMCLAGWPAASIGLWVNLALAGVLLFQAVLAR